MIFAYVPRLTRGKRSRLPGRELHALWLVQPPNTPRATFGLASDVPGARPCLQPRVSHHFGVSPTQLEELALKCAPHKSTEISDCYYDTERFALAHANCWLRVLYEVPCKATRAEAEAKVQASRQVVLVQVKHASKGKLTCDEFCGDAAVVEFIAKILTPSRDTLPAFAAAKTVELRFRQLVPFAVCDATRTVFTLQNESVHVDYFMLNYNKKAHYYLLAGCHHNSPAEWRASNIPSLVIGAAENVRTKAMEILYRFHPDVYSSLVAAGTLAADYTEHATAAEPFRFTTPTLASLKVPAYYEL